jgi:hypothetical protein
MEIEDIRRTLAEYMKNTPTKKLIKSYEIRPYCFKIERHAKVLIPSIIIKE